MARQFSELIAETMRGEAEACAAWIDALAPGDRARIIEIQQGRAQTGYAESLDDFNERMRAQTSAAVNRWRA